MRVESPVQSERALWASVLTPRELEVALLALRGLSNKEVASLLNVAEGTIKLHMHRILIKLGVRGRDRLIMKEAAGE